MKSGLLPRVVRSGAALLVIVACARLSRGQTSPEPPDSGPAPPYDAAQLDRLLGPIALYPDPVLALILPASTAPGDLVSAASYLAAKANPYDSGPHPWSESVVALIHYPALVEWMAQNLTWVQAVGAAFASEPGAVMQSIQRLRHRARDLGALRDTAQQEVVEEDGLIEIQPADPTLLYLPRYDPTVVYADVPEPGGAPFVSFGEPYQVGFWLTYGFDWRRQSLWVGRFSHDDRGWQRPVFFGQGAHLWRPSGPPATSPAYTPPFPTLRPGEPFVRPSLLPGAPPAPPPGSERWTSFPQRPGPYPSAFPQGQQPFLPGTPEAVAWEREREMRDRPARDRATYLPGATPQSSAHPLPGTPKPPTAPPPKPSPPPTPPAPSPSANEPHDHESH